MNGCQLRCMYEAHESLAHLVYFANATIRREQLVLIRKLFCGGIRVVEPPCNDVRSLCRYACSACRNVPFVPGWFRTRFTMTLT
eukprot:3976992-Pleurochrysis_carterae.AAC.2